MAILWCGGEDIDFPNSAPVVSSTITSRYRSTYARCAIQSASGSTFSGSNSFSGGAITSAWLSAQVYYNDSGTTGNRFVGLINVGSGNGSGIWFGQSSSSDNKMAIFKYDGTTLTQLALGATGVFNTTTQPFKWDLQVISYGSSSTVNLYWSGNLYCSYTGSTAISGVSNLDGVGIWALSGNSAGMSELIVSDTDTRAMNLMTMAPTSTGTTASWTGVVGNVNPVTINDGNSVFTNTVAQDEQFHLTTPASGTFSIPFVRIAARCANTTGATATQVALGFNSGGTVVVGSNNSLITSFKLVESVYTQNPVSSAAWTQSDLTSLQVDLRSA